MDNTRLLSTTFLLTSLSANISWRAVLQADVMVSSEFPISLGLEERRLVMSGRICFAVDKTKETVKSINIHVSVACEKTSTCHAFPHPWRSANCWSETCYPAETWQSSAGPGWKILKGVEGAWEPPAFEPLTDSWNWTPGREANNAERSVICDTKCSCLCNYLTFACISLSVLIVSYTHYSFHISVPVALRLVQMNLR